MDLKSKCLVCGSTQNLNTVLKISVKEVSYEISICDKHSENITVGKARDLVSKKLLEFEELKKKMLEFGVIIQEPGVVPLPSKPIEKQIEPIKKEVIKESVANKPISSKEASKPDVLKKIPKFNVPKVSSPDAQSYESLDVDGLVHREMENTKRLGKDVKLPEVAEIEMQTVNIPGAPIALPRKIKSDDGSTSTIIITKTSNADIMKRIKDDPCQSAYDLRECPLCKGSGFVQNGNTTCPKCNGKCYI